MTGGEVRGEEEEGVRAGTEWTTCPGERPVGVQFSTRLHRVAVLCLSGGRVNCPDPASITENPQILLDPPMPPPVFTASFSSHAGFTPLQHCCLQRLLR